MDTNTYILIGLILIVLKDIYKMFFNTYRFRLNFEKWMNINKTSYTDSPQSINTIRQSLNSGDGYLAFTNLTRHSYYQAIFTNQ